MILLPLTALLFIGTVLLIALYGPDGEDNDR